MCGLPGGYPDDLIDVDLDALEGEEGDGVIRVSNADYLARPLQLSPDRGDRGDRGAAGAAQRRGRRHPRGGRPHARPSSRRPPPGASTRPSTPAPTRSPTTVRATGRCSSAPPATSGRSGSPTTCPSRDEESERVVDPRGVVTAHGFAYLDAYCHSAEAPRLFRLDRIRSADGARHADPDPGRGAARPRRRDLPPVAGHHADHGPAGARRRAGSSSTTRSRRSARCDDGGLEVDLLIADERWLHRLLLRLAPNARVIAPAEFAEAFMARAQEALRLYA